MHRIILIQEKVKQLKIFIEEYILDRNIEHYKEIIGFCFQHCVKRWIDIYKRNLTNITIYNVPILNRVYYIKFSTSSNNVFMLFNFVRCVRLHKF